jgi:hypothetical protein
MTGIKNVMYILVIIIFCNSCIKKESEELQKSVVSIGFFNKGSYFLPSGVATFISDQYLLTSCNSIPYNEDSEITIKDSLGLYHRASLVLVETKPCFAILYTDLMRSELNFPLCTNFSESEHIIISQTEDLFNLYYKVLLLKKGTINTNFLTSGALINGNYFPKELPDFSKGAPIISLTNKCVIGIYIRSTYDLLEFSLSHEIIKHLYNNFLEEKR